MYTIITVNIGIMILFSFIIKNLNISFYPLSSSAVQVDIPCIKQYCITIKSINC